MRLNYKRTFFVGLAFLSICAFWQVYDNIIPLILQNTFHIRETITNSIMALDNILALFLLPFFGGLSDKTNSRYGKRTPYIMIGTIFAVIFMLLLPIADIIGNLILFVIALGLVLLAMGTYRSPAVALMPDVTPKRLRSKANAVINLMGALGGIFSLVAMKLLISSKDKPNYTYVFVSVALLMIIAVVILILTTKENKLASIIKSEDPDYNTEPVEDVKVKNSLPKDVRKSLLLILLSVFLWYMAYNAVITAFSRYAQNVWNIKGGNFATTLMFATGAAVISYIPIGFVSSRLGRKKTILIGIVLMFIAFASGYFFNTFNSYIYIVFALTGIGWAAINVNSYPMVVEISKGSDVGKYTGYYYTFSMAAQILTPVLSGILLEYVSYRTLFPYSTVFMVLAFCTMFFVKHGDVIPTPKKSVLENFDVED